MQYRITAYRGKVNSVVDLKDNIITAGVVVLPGSDDLFIICLDPIEAKGLAEETEKKTGKED